MNSKLAVFASWTLAMALTVSAAQAGIIQTGSGGTTDPGPWTSGVVTDSFTAMSVIPANFGALYDSGTGLVGGGAVSGDLYYAFTSRPLDRTGDTLLPAGSSPLTPHSPSSSFAAGQLVGTSPSLGISQSYGHYGLGRYIGADGTSGISDFSTRIDLATERVQLFEVHIHFNASANDTATILMSVYDNLPGQRQPLASDTPDYTRTMTGISGDFAFDSFQYISGTGNANPARWVFSDVVFATADGEAAASILAVPEPASFGLLAVGGLFMGLRRRLV